MQKPPTRFVIETFQLITHAVCCGYVLNPIGRRTINIPEIILGVHGFMGFTVSNCCVSVRFKNTFSGSCACSLLYYLYFLKLKGSE